MCLPSWGSLSEEKNNLQTQMGIITSKNKIIFKNGLRVLLYGVILCLGMIIFWKPLCQAIDISLLPLFSGIENNQSIIAIAITVCVVIIYCLRYKSLIKENSFSFRNSSVFLLLIALSFFRLYAAIVGDKYVFTGIIDGKIEYYCIALFEVFVAECICRIPHIKKLFRSSKIKDTDTTIFTTPFLPDIPTEDDKYDRVHYAEILVEKIISTQRELKNKSHYGSFNILLSERYGFGKTSFLLLVEKKCKEKNIEFITFRPWLCENPDYIVTDFFNLLTEKYIGDRHINKLLQLYSDVITSGVSKKIAKTILRFSKDISLETLHDNISKVLRNRENPFVIAIDDVDRLQYKELDSLIKLIRNTADFPNIFYIIAADKNAISQMLEVEGKVREPELYLQKFFNYELLFPASEDNTIYEVLSRGLQKTLGKYKNFNVQKYDFNSLIHNNYIKLSDIFHQPRDVYRYLNMLSFELDNINNELRLRHSDIESVGDNDICLKDLMEVLIIRYLMPEIYKIFRDNKDKYFLDLQKDGRLVLANEYANYFNSQFSRRYDGRRKLDYDIFDLASSATSIDVKQEKVSSFEEIIKKNEPQKEDIVLSIFRDLWSGDRTIDSDQPSINKHDEFFRYFSGRWERNKLSIYDAKAKMMSPNWGNEDSSAEFRRWVDGVISCNKMDSLINRTNDIVYGGIDISKRFDLLVNIFTCIHKQNVASSTNIRDCYNTWDKAIKQLLQKDNKSFQDYYPQFHSFITQSNEFEICSLFLMSIKSQIIQYNEYKERNSHILPCIFTEEQYDEMSKLLIDRFFAEIVAVTPYDTRTIGIHFFCKMVNVKYWKTKFRDYLASLKHPLVWLYGAFYWYDKEKLFFWNDNLVYSLYNGGNVYESLVEIFGDLLSEEYKSCLKKIPNPDFNRGNGFEGEDNQLLIDSRKWQLDEGYPFPKMEWLK